MSGVAPTSEHEDLIVCIPWGVNSWETQRSASQAEGRGFESRFPLQNTYTLRKAGHFAQPLSFQADGHLLSRQRVCAALPAFGGPGLPPAALPDTDGVLAPHRVAA